MVKQSISAQFPRLSPASDAYIQVGGTALNDAILEFMVITPFAIQVVHVKDKEDDHDDCH
jgi:hypothetical protein